MVKAYGYIRVSGKSQIEGDGFRRQEKSISDYADTSGVHVKKFYYEEGVSGTSDMSERPAFTDMLTAILKNGVRTIVVEGLDRLAREYRIQETILIYLASKGIDLIDARTGENVTSAISDDPMKKAMVQIQGVFAELDKNQIVKKLRVARENIRKEKGKCEGRKSMKESDPDTYKELKRLRRKRNGIVLSYAKIAKKMNDNGFKTQSGKAFTGNNVKALLSKK